MCKLKSLIFIFISLICISSKSFSQIVATPSTGCAPQNITFTGPPGFIMGSLNFGNGQPPVVVLPASHNYLVAGNYTAVLTGTFGGLPTTYTTLVKINPPPTAGFNFSVPPNHCAPMTATFVNTSTSPTTITQYQWTFGDGGSSTFTNVNYPYTIAGSFNATLTVTDANGCSASIAHGPINVSTPPVVVINTNPSPAAGCTAPFNCSFSGSNCVSGSPTGNGMTFNWGFGNGQTSGLQTPGSITYATVGSYVTTLTVTDNNNCTASLTIPVNVSMPAVSVTMPTFVCIYDTLKANDNSVGGFTTWQFGDGTTSGLITPAAPPYINVKKYFYATPGIKTITITAYGGGTCTAVQIKTISVEQVTAAITATPPTFSCNSPFICPYFNASSVIAIPAAPLAYSWTVFNCNNTQLTSNVANPSFTITQGSLNPYTIYPYCVPSVLLKVTTVNGCTNAATYMSDTLRKPTAWFNKNKKEGCVPLTVNFRDSSQAYLSPYPYSITGYTWNNGAQPPTIISGPPPTFSNVNFTYSTTGTYTPYLIIQTAQGCIDTSFVDTVYVASPAPLSFSFSPNVVCPNQTVQIINTSPNQNLIQHWHVISDNGYFSGCVSNGNPGWVFTHIGAHTFTLEAWKHSCASSTTIPQTVQVNGPIVQGRFQTNCTNRKTVLFSTQIQDALTTSLNFGDGTPTVTIPGVLGTVVNHTVNHTYANTGDYTATVIGSNGSGTCSPYTYTMQVKVRDVQADMALSPTVCVNLPTVFSAASSTDVLVSCNSTGYTWFFDNSPPVVTTFPNITNAFPAPGIHTVVLMVKDENSCTDTVIRTIRASSASPAFNVSPNPLCLSTGTVQFNNTTSQLPDPILGYTWGFGIGGAFSFATNPIFNYTYAAVPNSTYAVVLTATNVLGCVASTSIVMQVNNPSAVMNALPSANLCTPTGTVNIAAPPGYTSYSLDYGDGTPNYVGGSNSTVHSYTAPGTYSATILITDNVGCQNTSTLVLSVQSYPIPSFTIGSPGAQFPNTACLGNNITFSSTSTSSPTYSFNYDWDLGTGSPIVNQPMVATSYSAVGNYPVSLTVSTIPNGCARTFTRMVSVFGANADLNLDKKTICLGEAIKFNIKSDSSTVFAWVWDFADGTPSSTIMANPAPSGTLSHTYLNYPLPNGSATVSLIYYSSMFACKFFATQAIQVIKVNSDFTRNGEIAKIDSVHCLGTTDYFSNSLVSPGALFNWDFGNGNTSNVQNPSYTYSVAGVYPVSFTVTENVVGCIGVAVKNMTINPIPTASISVRDTCQGTLFPLIGKGSGIIISNTWTPSNGVTNINSLITTATASASTDYTLTVTDINGCVGSTVQNVYIQLPPNNISWDTSVVIGQSIPVNGNAGINMSYTWAPPIDLSCILCVNPISTSTNNITYTVSVADNMGCFVSTNTYSIHIDQKGSLDVPTAFTPNGDGANDVIYVDGWGIKKLNYFKIFNRWGQLLFESNDIKVGWNGQFNGTPQNMETYVYQVSAETYIDKEPILKTGSFKLIR